VRFRKKQVYLQLISLFIGIFLTIYKIYVSADLAPVVDPYDSPSYFNFRLIGGVRMPIITFIFSSFDTYESITLFHLIFSSICWIVLSQTFFVLKVNVFFAFLISLLTLSLGFSNQVYLLDGFINAESLNISALTLLISTLIMVIVKRSPSSFFLFYLSIIFYAGIKSINALSAIFIIMIITGFIYINGNLHKKAFALILGISSFLISLLFYFFVKVDATPILNTSALINQRIWNVNSWKTFVLEEGFPVQARSTFVRFKSRDLGIPPDAAVSLQPDYKKWYEEEGGKSFLVNFMKSNLDYTLLGPIAFPIFDRNYDLSLTIWGGASTGILNSDIYRSAWNNAWPTNAIFWNTNRANGYIQFSLFLLIISIALFPKFNSNKSDRDIQSIIMILMIIGLQGSYFAWWFGSTPTDIGRHQFPFAVMTRVAFILSILRLGKIVFDKIQKIKS
jgi:hypothetical protein